MGAPQAEFENICSESRGRSYLNQLDRACEARGVTEMGEDAPATRCVRAAADNWRCGKHLTATRAPAGPRQQPCALWTPSALRAAPPRRRSWSGCTRRLRRRARGGRATPALAFKSQLPGLTPRLAPQVERALIAETQALEGRRAAVSSAAALLKSSVGMSADLELAAHVASKRHAPLAALQ